MQFSKQYQRLLLCAFFLALAFFLGEPSLLGAEGLAFAAVRVMPLGDSITEGTLDAPGGYRPFLWQALGGNVDFVGSLNSAGLNHEGHPGWRIDMLTGSIDGWMAAYQPDIVLLDIGTNDVVQNYDLPNAQSRLQALVNRICQDRPGVKVVVGSLIPHPGIDPQVNEFNSHVPTVAAIARGSGCRAYSVDMNVVTSGDIADGTHPTASGFAKMAYAWLPYVQGAGSAQAPAASPTPTAAQAALSPTPTATARIFTPTPILASKVTPAQTHKKMTPAPTKKVTPMVSFSSKAPAIIPCSKTHVTQEKINFFQRFITFFKQLWPFSHKKEPCEKGLGSPNVLGTTTERNVPTPTMFLPPKVWPTPTVFIDQSLRRP